MAYDTSNGVITSLLDRRLPGAVNADVGAVISPSPVNVLQSLDFDGTTGEYLANETNTALGLSTAWTVNIWWKRTGAFSTNQYSFLINNGSNNQNLIRIEVDPGQADRLNFLLYDDDGTNYKNFLDNDHFTTGAWIMTSLTWTAGTLVLYKNGASTVPNVNDGSANSTVAQDRRISRIGFAWPGYIHSVGLWSTALSANALAKIYADKTAIDLRVDTGDYNGAASLQHWWVPGADVSAAPNLGIDYGIGTPINVMTNASNITLADLVSDYPT